MLTDPPRNGGYLVAAYAVTTLILLLYWVRLWRRARTVLSPRPPET